MKNIKMSSKFIELIKTNGKRFLCALVTTIMLMIPHTGKTEETTNNNSQNQTKIEQRVESMTDISITVGDHTLETDIHDVDGIEEIFESADLSSVSTEPVFVMYSNWEKTNNYSSDKGYEKDNREYQRTVYRFTPNDRYNPEYFNEDYVKLLRFFRDDVDASSIFDVISKEVEVITLSKEEEEALDTTHIVLEVEGSDIKIEILTKNEEDSERRKEIIMGICAFAPPIIFMIVRYKKYGIMGLK